VSGVFVTSTGTDIGKTFVTAGLIRELRRRGQNVHAIKPVVSGFDPDKSASSDPSVLLDALGKSTDIDAIEKISPWRFSAHLSPDSAARHEGRAINFDDVVAFSKEASTRFDGTLFIEGVGGVMVPLDDGHTVLDWMEALGLPVLLVAGSYLGTISHTLSALEVLASRQLRVQAIIISESVGSSVPTEEIFQTIMRFANHKKVFSLPRLQPGQIDHPMFVDVVNAL
jgi:dethiobiotin synthetase